MAQKRRSPAGRVPASLITEVQRIIALLLAPMSPYLAHELWEMTGETSNLLKAPWPKYDAALAAEDEIEIPVQVNGKLRGMVVVPAAATDDEVMRLAAGNDFRDIGLADIAAEAEVPLSTIRRKIRRQARHPRRILAAGSTSRSSTRGRRKARARGDRLFEALMRRFEALVLYRDALLAVSSAPPVATQARPKPASDREAVADGGRWSAPTSTRWSRRPARRRGAVLDLSDVLPFPRRRGRSGAHHGTARSVAASRRARHGAGSTASVR